VIFILYIQQQQTGVCARNAKFPVWINRDCKGMGHFIVTPHTRFEETNVIPALLHFMKFYTLSTCRVGTVTANGILRGIISEDNGNQLRIASDALAFSGATAVKPEWDATHKHQIMWIIGLETLYSLAGLETHEDFVEGKGGGKGKFVKSIYAIAPTGKEDVDWNLLQRVWSKGSLHLTVSAPRSNIGKWRIWRVHWRHKS